MKAARARFLRRALAVLAVAVLGSTAVVLALVYIPADTGPVPLAVAAALLALLLGLSAPALGNGAALIRIRRMRPDALVFLARREPTLAPDLPVYLKRRGLSVDVSDRWMPAVVDARGIAPWSGGLRPRELFVMQWSEIGGVTATEFRSIDGEERFGISVDVAPFPTPLIVRVGDSMLGFQSAFDRRGTIAVGEAANAQRPVSARPA
jgi:hypothetical protein